MKTFPRVADHIGEPIDDECELCGNPAKRAVRIAYNDDGDDDDSFDVCDGCYKRAHVDPLQFVRDYIKLTVEIVDDFNCGDC